MTEAPPTIGLHAMKRGRPDRRRFTGRIIAPPVIIGLFVIAAIVVPMLYNYDPISTDLLSRLRPPGSVVSNGSVAFLGTDQNGQDLVPQIMDGTRVSLIVGTATLLVAGVSGVLLGLLAGYFGGWLDMILMRIADIQLAFPSILLAVLIASVLGQGVLNVIIVLSISNWVVFARVTRSSVLSLKTREYVEAARTLGSGHAHLMFRTLLPGCMAPILVIATVEFGQVILSEAALSFLGVGVPLGTPSLGSTISNGIQYMATSSWIATLPGIVLVILVLTTGIFGDALRDHFDPRLRSA